MSVKGTVMPDEVREAHARLARVCRRLRFLKPDQKHIAPNERPPFGCVLLIWGDPDA